MVVMPRPSLFPIFRYCSSFPPEIKVSRSPLVLFLIELFVARRHLDLSPCLYRILRRSRVFQDRVWKREGVLTTSGGEPRKKKSRLSKIIKMRAKQKHTRRSYRRFATVEGSAEANIKSLLFSYFLQSARKGSRMHWCRNRRLLPFGMSCFGFSPF